jgi:iron complex transport system ATP-binding protein
MIEAILEARGLVFDYPGPLRALAGVDLAIGPGELVAVIGPNGSGKTTLVKALAGLVAPSAGEVLLEGRPVSAHSARERARRIAVVPQFLPALYEVRVDEFVLSGRYARTGTWRRVDAADRAIARRALEECDAGDLAARTMAAISGGQRQRVLVARALAQEAVALLIDEPTSGLDPEHQIRVLDLIASLRGSRPGSPSRADRAALFVTHDLNLASQYATRLVLLDGGRVVAEGDARAVLRRDVLEPVYGGHLTYGEWPAGPGDRGAARPFVLPTRAS